MPDETIVESYNPERFIKWDSWGEVKRIVEGRGSCCGVGGARGAGKSWLLRYASAYASDDARGGVGLYFPTPSAYDSTAFLSGLCLALATALADRLQPRRRSIFAAFEFLNTPSGKLAAAIVMIGTLIFLFFQYGVPYARTWQSLVTWVGAVLISIGLFGIYILVLTASRQRSLDRDPGRKLYLRSLAVQNWIQYASSKKSASEFALEAGRGLVGRGRVSQELALSERPVTELSLVTEFRALAEEAARILKRKNDQARVVIAIDELDKIGSIDDTRKLLRSVKGVLDPMGVTTLVSVSDEAVTHLGLSGLRGRDEISSSFTTMLYVPPLTLPQCKKLVGDLHPELPAQTPAALLALAAGNQREIVRLLDDCLRKAGTNRAVTAEFCRLVAEENETDQFLAALITERDINESVRAQAFAWVRHYTSMDFTDGKERIDYLLEAWRPVWTGDWPAESAEQWRRFLVRKAIRVSLASEHDKIDDDRAVSYRELFYLSQYSSGIALDMAAASLPLFTLYESWAAGTEQGMVAPVSLSTLVQTTLKMVRFLNSRNVGSQRVVN